MDLPENRVALIELRGRDGRMLQPLDVLRWPVQAAQRWLDLVPGVDFTQRLPSVLG